MTIAALENPTPLGGATLARKWVVQVDFSADPLTPDWKTLRGIKTFAPSEDPTNQDDSVFDDGGWKSTVTTAFSWGAEATVSRKTKSATDRTAYDDVQEYLRLISYQQSPGNECRVRYFEWNGLDGPRVQAYTGQVSVSYRENGGAPDATSEAVIGLSGQGRRIDIAHPFGPAVWATGTVYTLGQRVFGSDGSVLQATTATGTSGSTEPDENTLTDGTVTWKVVAPA